MIAVAYCGSNAKIQGNISNSYWTHTAIDIIEETIKTWDDSFYRFCYDSKRLVRF